MATMMAHGFRNGWGFDHHAQGWGLVFMVVLVVALVLAGKKKD